MVNGQGARSRVLILFLIPLFLLSLGVIPAAGKAPWGRIDPAHLSAEDLQAKAQSYQALLPKAQQVGSVRVIVTLNIPFKPEGLFQVHASVQAQRNGIAITQAAVAKRLESFNASVLRKYKYVPIMLVRVDPDGLADLAANPNIVSIQEDVPEPPTLAQSIPLIGADQAWASGYTGSGQVIAILDTGVDGSHAFLAGKVVAEACFSTTGGSPPYNSTTVCPDASEEQIGPGAGVNCPLENDGCDHGTHVAGIAAGKGGSFSGVAKDADIIAVQVFSRFNHDDYCGDGNSPCVLSYPSDQIAALEWVFGQSASFNIASANMSLGGGRYTNTSDCDWDHSSRKDIIDTLRSVGIATVIASGNSYYRDAIGAPACISSAISVGSTNDYEPVDDVSEFSNIASFISLLAPGLWIYSSVPDGGYANWGGTSMSAPHVAGAWAVLKSKAPAASVDQVLAALRDTGVLVDDTRILPNGIITDMPRIQVDAAVAALDDSTPTPTETSTSTSTNTPTSTSTSTSTSTPTSTSTSTPTDTPTPTATSTSTSTSTDTSTPTETLTPTETPTPSDTSTPTDTPTVTATFTSTSTSTPTTTPIGTSTPTDTPTSTSTPTSTPTAIFDDVPPGHWAYDYINALYEAGYVAGCSAEPRLYCPSNTMNRAESAVFVERGIHGGGYMPDNPTEKVFADVGLSQWYAKWANALWEDSYTAGCGTNPLIYCPTHGHTRAEGCVFYIRMLYGPDYFPPDPTEQVFADVSLDEWYAKWVHAANDAGLILPCQESPELLFCPNGGLSRDVAAYMMVQAKGGLP